MAKILDSSRNDRLLVPTVYRSKQATSTEPIVVHMGHAAVRVAKTARIRGIVGSLGLVT